MQTSRSNRTSSTCRGCQALAGLAALIGGLHANVARADWGENWGEMTWGSVSVPVPMLGDWGLLLLATLLLTVALWTIAKRRGQQMALLMLVALAVPLTAVAATIAVPNIFSNGTTADATEVNANFDTLVAESNDQDSRLSLIEGLMPIHGTDPSAHHVRYSDGEALNVMGPVENTNPLHHFRYNDAEALAAAVGVDAGTLDGLDSTDFAGASHAHSYGKVAIVAQSGGVYTDPKTAMDNLATWCGTPSAVNPCLVRIMPGVYDLGNNALTMQSYVDIEGSGENTTTITSTHSSASSTPEESSATVVGAGNAEIRFLTIENQGGNNYAGAFYNPPSASPDILNVTVIVSGSDIGYGVLILSSSPRLTNVTIMASGAVRGWGVFSKSSALPASPVIRNCTISATDESIVSNSTDTAKVVASMLDGSVSGTGFACVGAYDSSFVALDAGCL